MNRLRGPTGRLPFLYTSLQRPAELRRDRSVPSRCLAGVDEPRKRFLLSCRRTASAAAIPERLSSSSLPPSFAPGRCATVFTPRGTAAGGAPSFVAGAPR